MQKKILLYNSGGGLGDSVQLFSLILSLQNHFKNSEVYYLSAHENHFENKLKEYNINIKNLDLNLKYFGFRWWHYLVAKKRVFSNGIESFDLIIDLQSKLRNTVILNKIPSSSFYSRTFNYYFCSKKRDYFYSNDFTYMTIKNLNVFLETTIKRINYSLENIDDRYKKEAKRLLPNNGYVGFSVTQGNIYRKKTWSIDKFIELAKKIKDKNKVPVFFIKEDEFDLIDKIKNEVDNALFPEHNSKLSCPALVTALSARLDKAISIDNGIMHMMGLANIPMIVLFGPTNSEKFAPKIDDITIIDTKEIYKSSDISKIGVSDVFKHV